MARMGRCKPILVLAKRYIVNSLFLMLMLAYGNKYEESAVLFASKKVSMYCTFLSSMIVKILNIMESNAQSILSPLTGPPSPQPSIFETLFSNSLGATTSIIPSQGLINHLIPYLILVINYVIFQLMRSLSGKLLATTSSKNHQGWLRLGKLLLDEMISTCELCADCAELNVVYEKHGSFAYGLALFVLSYVWIETFGDAHTTPNYIAEDYFLDKGNDLLKTGDTYARFIGQSLAMPMAWRMAAIYWRYHLLSEHSSMLQVENCRSSLTTNSFNGFIIELVCCLVCRLTELCTNRLLERKYLSQRIVSATCSFVCSLLVVMALDLSGGYFNPILAASLEYGCKGIEWHQHAFVFWLGPLSGHLLARLAFRRYIGESAKLKQQQQQHQLQSQRSIKTDTTPRRNQDQQQIARKPARSSPRKKSRSDKID